MKDPEGPQKHPTKLVQNSWATDYEIINTYHCFKPLSFRAICYATIDNQYKNYLYYIYAQVILILKCQICSRVIFSHIFWNPQPISNFKATDKTVGYKVCLLYKNQTSLDLVLTYQYLNPKETRKENPSIPFFSPVSNVLV